MWFRTPSLSSIAKRTTILITNTVGRPLSSEAPLSTCRARRVAEIARELRANTKGDDPLPVIASAGRGAESVTSFVRDLAKAHPDPTLLLAVDTHTVKDALRRYLSCDATVPEREIPGDEFPPWFGVYCLYHKSHSPQDVLTSLDLVRRTLPRVPPSVSDSIVVLAVAELSQNRLTAVMREFIQRFCAARHTPSRLHFNLLLRAISLHPRSKGAGALVVQILERMSQHGMKVRKQTYNALLHPGFVTLEVASAVQRKMNEDCIRPSSYQLQCLCQLMITHRQRAKAGRYLHALRLKQKEEKIKWTRHDKRLQARYLKAFRKPALALRYLTHIVWLRNRLARRMRRRRRATVTVHQWLYTLQVASRSPQVTAERLLQTFRQSVSAYPFHLAVYLAVIRGLLSKHDYTHAAQLWDEALSHHPPLNTLAVTVGVSVLTMNGRPDGAFQLLEDVAAARTITEPKTRWGHATVSLRALHHFMISLRRMGRPDVVFALFDHMEALYGLRPDVYTINILLQTARWARKFEDTIRGQLAVIGIEPSRNRWSETDGLENTRAQPASRIAALLDPNRRSWVTGRWNSEPAGQVALKHAVQVFLGNWPWLADIPSPVQALRRGSEDAALKPVSEVFNRVTERPLYDKSPLLSLLPEMPAMLYPEVMPTDVTFRALIDLLASQSLQTEIPLVLAWMRALDIQPSKATFATALVHWVDVSMDSPFIERLKGMQRRDPYALLMQWMEDWVGPERMPKREEMSDEMRRAAWYRDVRYLDIISERNRAAAGRRGSQ